MTTSPLLPASVVRHAVGTEAETEATEAELDRMVELALRRDARAVALGCGRLPAATVAAAGFARRWQATGRIVLDTVTWAEEAASWRRQAVRLAAADPDLWVMAGPPGGWAQLTRRLLWSTPWQPGRTIAFAALGTPRAIGLVGPINLPGLTGASADGGTWMIRDGQLETVGQDPAPLATGRRRGRPATGPRP